MKRRSLIFILFGVLILSSCSLPAATPAIDTPVVPTQPTLNIPITSEFTPTPSISATPVVDFAPPSATPTSTPSVTLAGPRQQPVNCRVGPDISYAVIGALNLGTQAEVIGKNIDITWLYVRNPSDPSTNCWLSVDFIDVQGNVDLLPVVGPPEIMVTSIKVSVDPVAMNVACDGFPRTVTVSARITTNGPTIVTWYWESSVGKTSPQKQILFAEGGSNTVQDYYQVDQAGDYSIQVKTVLPNVASGETTFKAICTP